jgi:Spy/CpxP family protein refolding chaperone
MALASSPVACKGCGGSSGAGGSGPTASTSASSSASAAPRPPLPSGGPFGAVFQAIESQSLNAEQRAVINKAAAELRAGDELAKGTDSDAGPRASFRQMQAELAAGVKGGKVDLAKLNEGQSAVERVTKARQAREAEALTKIQRVLTPAQRQNIASSIRTAEEKTASRIEKHDKHEKRDGGRAEAGRNDAGAPNWARLRLESYVRDLGLDAGQQKSVDALLAKETSLSPRAESKAQRDAMLSAFEKDGFDALAFRTDDVQPRMAAFLDLASFLAQVVPTLRPEQRDKLATKFEKGPEPTEHNRRRGPRDYKEQDDDPE